MKTYFLTPRDGDGWLAPEAVVERLRTAFDRIDVSVQTAREQGGELIAKFRRLMRAGMGNANSTRVDELELRWANALSIVAAIGDDDGEWIQTTACNGYRLEIAFGPAVSGRKHRYLAEKAAKALGYVIDSVDGD